MMTISQVQCKLAVAEQFWQERHQSARGQWRESMKLVLNIALVVALSALVAACNNGPKGVRISKDGTSASTSKEGQAIRDLNAPEIGQRIIGKTFQYTRADGNGFVTYNGDGTFDYQDDQRGEGKGRWVASGTQYCETFGPDAQQECGTFRATGDAYFAAKSRLVEMKI
jgi:hypothetical protein